MAASSTQVDLPEEQGSVTTITYLGNEVDAEHVGKRNEINYITHMKKYDDLIALLTEELEKKKKKSEPGTRVFAKAISKLSKMQTEVPKVAKSMKKKRKSTNATSGFSIGCKISDELAAFIKVDSGTILTRSEISNALNAYIRLNPNEEREDVLKWSYLNPEGKRNLQDQTNKTRIIPDRALSKLLKYDAYQKDVAAGKVTKGVTNKITKEKEYTVQTDDKLYYQTIQKLIQRHI